MNDLSHRNERARVKAASELAQLQQQAQEARAVLTQLQQQVDDAETRLDSSRAAELLEANKQLVLTTLRAQTHAATCAQALEEMSRSARLDALTELPNRVLLLDRFAQAIATAKRHNARLALLFVDLDNFKWVNDTLGHAVGDEVLKLAAQCLASSVRESDTVSRHGGDEFLILLTDVSQASDAVLIANKMIAALGAPRRVSNHMLRLTASIGISIYPDDGEDAQTLIKRADAAMYHAKWHGLGSFVVQDGELSNERSLEPPAPGSLQRPWSQHRLALGEHERQHARLRETNEQLVLTALSAEELQTAAAQAQRRHTEFLALVAHELRNPWAPIPTAAAKLRLERRVVDMAGIIDEAIDACRPTMDARLQRLQLSVPSSALEVDGDPVRLAQILCNLLDNASKYAPDRGKIGLSVAVVDDAMVMTVSDSGMGITAEALPHVFDPFVQDPRATILNGDCLGIGLTVVRELVVAHGGTVVATSAGSGLGSQFIVTLPLTEQPPVAQ